MRKNCLFLLLCCILLVCFPSCRKEPQTVDVKFKDAYLPVTQLSVSDFTIGMTIEEVELLLEPLEVNQEYVYWHGHYFFRAVNGESVLLEITADEAGRYHVTNVQTTLVSQLATRQDYMSLEKGMSVSEVIQVVGLPIYTDLYISAISSLDFPVSDGSICKVYFTRNYTSPFVLYSIEFS